jgi:hypothetical protein
MPGDAGLHQMMRQHGHREARGAADLHGVGIGRANPKMLGEHGRQHDVRRDGGVTAENAVDLAALQAGIRYRKLGGLAHQVERGRTLMPAECREANAGDEAHGCGASLLFVIPGCASWRRPGIHTPRRGYGFRARSPSAKLMHASILSQGSRPGMTA